MAGPKTNGWSKWENHVLAELERHSDQLGRMDKKLDRIAEIQAALSVRAGIWGLLGGSIPVAITVGIGLALWLVKSSA